MSQGSRERPLIFGYYSARSGIPVERLMTERQRLEAFAHREGYAVANIFAEPSTEPSVALQALLESAARVPVAAVVVPEVSDLGTDEPTQLATRERLERAGIRLLVLVRGAA
ncbi:MAG TPA: hypothetical protein VLL08_00680 [Kineosporiaceae bacterium]|nr:hypothetical protein [Kineosporiaceae bacterium]